MHLLPLVAFAALVYQPPGERFVFRPATKGDVVFDLRERGEVEPASLTDVICRVRAPDNRGAIASTIVWLIDEGANVKRGDVVARLDDREAADHLRQSQVNHDQARAALAAAELERTTALARIRCDVENAADQVALTEVDLTAAKDEAERKRAEIRLRQSRRLLEVAKVEAEARKARADAALAPAKAAQALAEAEVNAAKLSLSQCTVAAPREGVVVFATANSRLGANQQSLVAVGETVREGQRLMRILDSSALVVRTRVLEAHVARVRPGQEAQVETVAGQYLGKVSAISAAADASDWMTQDVKVHTVTIALNGSQGEKPLRPGMTADVKLRVAEKTNVMRVPIQAVRVHQGRSYCFVKTGGGAEARPVATGIVGNHYIEITQGLKEGDEVALNPPFAPPTRSGAMGVEPRHGSDLAARSVRPASEGPRRSFVLKYGLTVDDLAAVRVLLPGVLAAAPTRLLPADLRSRGGETLSCVVSATVPECVLFQPELGDVATGRFLCQADELATANVIVLSAEAALVLFPAADPLGQIVHLVGKAQPFVVVGVLNPPSRPAAKEQPRAWISFTSSRMLLGELLTIRQQGTRGVEQVQVSELLLRFATPKEGGEAAAIMLALLEQRRPQRDWQVTPRPAGASADHRGETK